MLIDYPKRSSRPLPMAIRAIRLRLGLNGTEFGLLLGATPGEISKYESGKNTPGVLRLMKLIRLASADQQKVLLLALSKYGLTAHDISTPLAPETIQQQPEALNV